MKKYEKKYDLTDLQANCLVTGTIALIYVILFIL